MPRLLRIGRPGKCSPCLVPRTYFPGLPSPVFGEESGELSNFPDMVQPRASSRGTGSPKSARAFPGTGERPFLPVSRKASSKRRTSIHRRNGSTFGLSAKVWSVQGHCTRWRLSTCTTIGLDDYAIWVSKFFCKKSCRVWSPLCTITSLESDASKPSLL
jgi:hypothetical protein